MLAIILIIIFTCVALYKLNKALDEETGTFVDATEPLERKGE